MKIKYTFIYIQQTQYGQTIIIVSQRIIVVADLSIQVADCQVWAGTMQRKFTQLGSLQL